MKFSIIIFYILIFIYVPLFSTEYYIDYENGDDMNNGLSELTAWKHSPGDASAADNPDNIVLQPGDVLLFKGGVVYRGEIRIQYNGEEGNPIIYKGDGWGNEKAVIDGSDDLSGNWVQCMSASECKENPDFYNIYYTDMPDNFDFFSGFYEDNQFLWFAQDPDPSSRYDYDNISGFFTIPLGHNFSATELTDSGYFNQTDPLYWQGSYIIAWHIPNVTTTHPITSFSPETSTITFTDLGGGGIYTDRDSYYAILNHISHITQPGEYCVDTIQKRIYLWSLGSDDPNNHIYSYKTRQHGIVYTRRKNLVIEGFEVRNFVMGIRADAGDIENITIRNNLVKNLRSNNWYAIQMNGKNITVENNRIEDCIRAVGILAAGENITVKDNYVKNTSRQGIWFMGVTRGTITGNTVTDIRGTHSNGISAYLYNKDILVASNKVLNSNISFTFHGENSMPDLLMNLTVYNNYFENSCHSWGNHAKDIKVINNVCREGFFYNENDSFTISVNNIFHGGGDASVNRNNIYTDLGWWQMDRYGWSLSDGEIDWSEKDINDIFIDITNGDIYLKEGSPAIDTGMIPLKYLPVDMFPEYDFNRDLFGNIRPRGRSWDVGAHEYDNGFYYGESQCMINNSPVKVYPIPFKDIVNIYSSEECSIKVYSVTGDLLYNNNKKEIDLSVLNTGVYVMKIKTSAGGCSVKVIKE